MRQDQPPFQFPVWHGLERDGLTMRQDRPPFQAVLKC